MKLEDLLAGFFVMLGLFAFLALVGLIVVSNTAGFGVRLMIETTRYMSPAGKLLSLALMIGTLVFLSKAIILEPPGGQ